MSVELTTVVRCPKCERRLRVHWKSSARTIRVVCPICRRPFRVHRPVPSPEETEGSTVPIGSESLLCYIGVADPTIAQRLAIPLVEGMGARTALFTDGLKLWDTLVKTPPDLLVVEAWLPNLMGFEIIERVRACERLHELSIILVGSVSPVGRYRRPPTHRYGADAYVDPNIAPLAWQKLIMQLLRKRQARSEEPLIEDERQARRLARLLLTDLALYHSEKFYKALEDGDLRSDLSQEIHRFHQYFRQRVSPRIWRHRDYFEEYLHRIERSRHVSTLFQEAES